MVFKQFIGKGIDVALVQALVLITLSACGGEGGESDSSMQRNAQESELQHNEIPTISGNPSGQVVADVEYIFQPVASDLDGDPLNFTIFGAPTWVNFDSGSGRISGTPADEDVGLNSGIRINVSDGAASAALPPFSIMVIAATVPNQAPTISGTPAGQTTAGFLYEFRPVGSDPDGDDLRYTVSGLPEWAGFDTQTGRLFGTPGLSDVGVISGIVITVSDGVATGSIGPFSIQVDDVIVAQRKYNPGHYVSMNPKDDQADMVEALRPGVKGVQRRYYWNKLETSFNNYDFAEVESDLDLLASQGKQLIILIEDKTFNGEIPTPLYLQNDYTLPNRAGGFTAIRWKPYVVDRFTKLIDELGQQFDSHPAFEGVAIQESALGFDASTLAANGYTPEIYRDALIEMLTRAAASIPTSTVFWYMNYFPQKMAYISVVANAVTSAGVAVGGPDVLPDDYGLKTHTYPLFDQLENTVTLFNSIQYNSYNHVHMDTSYPTTYWTLDELFQFARDELHVSYLFWNRKTWRDPDDSYTWADALPTIENNQTFN